MATRVPASVRTREELQALIDGRLGRSDERSALLRLATRLIVEEALEAEVEDAVTAARVLPTQLLNEVRDERADRRKRSRLVVRIPAVARV